MTSEPHTTITMKRVRLAMIQVRMTERRSMAVEAVMGVEGRDTPTSLTAYTVTLNTVPEGRSFTVAVRSAEEITVVLLLSVVLKETRYAVIVAAGGKSQEKKKKSEENSQLNEGKRREKREKPLLSESGGVQARVTLYSVKLETVTSLGDVGTPASMMMANDILCGEWVYKRFPKDAHQWWMQSLRRGCYSRRR